MRPAKASASIRKSGSISLLLHLILLLSLSLGATAYPLLGDIDPWHGHVVVGGSNRADQILAFLNHRHPHPGEHYASEIDQPGGPLILSIAEQVMLSALASFASETALIPTFTFPVHMIFFAILAIGLMLPDFKMAVLPPPSPPPRRIS